ncbi:hypothetical protein BX600DRAFT_459035 [Xylariales sp. PMI_506]|nr:hypothetical protein BX600DRAFT_459035 [Xylariales sp. PMI_506]
MHSVFSSSSKALVWLTIFFFAACSIAQSNNGTTDSSNSTLSTLFVSPTIDLAFALNVPSDSSTDLYFSMMIPSEVSWGAVGLGSSQMAGALVLMMYASSSGSNVTMSPRLASRHSEPVYTPDINIQALAGTGLLNESTYVFNGLCSNCRSWTGGSIDVASTAQSFIYATGPNGDIRSDDPAAAIKMHQNYGNFQMNLVAATGPGAIPDLATHKGTALIASSQGTTVTNMSDVAAMIHAVLMVFCFVGLYPFGILIIRLGNWVRWHAVNQGLALMGIIAAVGLGIHSSSFYNRSKNFNSPHQIIGLFIFIFVLAQFVLGFMHHRIYKKTEQPTKLAPVHVWLGRLIVLLAVINAFLGFRFALSPQYNWILAGLVIFIFPAVAVIVITKNFFMKRLNRDKEGDASQGGYDMEPWRQPEATQPQYEHRTTVTAGPNGPTTVLSDTRSYANYHNGSDKRADMGPQHAVQEYV